MSQSTLAKLLDVTEQTVHRWETGKSEIIGTAQSLIRFLYAEQELKTSDHGVKIKRGLEKLADLENEIDGKRVTGNRKDGEWQMEMDLAA